MGLWVRVSEGVGYRGSVGSGIRGCVVGYRGGEFGAVCSVIGAGIGAFSGIGVQGCGFGYRRVCWFGYRWLGRLWVLVSAGLLFRVSGAVGLDIGDQGLWVRVSAGLWV